MDSFQDRLEQIEEVDRMRNNLIKELVSKVDSLTRERDKAQSSFERLEDSCEIYQKSAKQAKAELRDLEKRNDCGAFVLVLIDGDNALFKDEYIRRGRAGGHDAARDLRMEVGAYLETLEGFKSHWEILIQVYTKVIGLSKKYVQEDIIPDLESFRSFTQAFNEAGPYCDYIHAGEDKEGADYNISGKMRLFYQHVQCKHIILAASGDNSYIGFLRQFMLTNEVCDRITLLEALDFTKDLKEIAPGFLTTRLPKIFRKTKLPASIDRTGTKAMSGSYASRLSGSNDRYDDKEESTPSSFPSVPGSPHTQSNPAPFDTMSNKIHRNKDGFRIDRDIKPNLDIVKALKTRKLCNRHYLSRCPFDDCLHEHKAKLNPQQLEALRYIARMSPCKHGVSCNDISCVSGHRCIYDGHCNYGNECKFGPEMHHVDTEVGGCIVV